MKSTARSYFWWPGLDRDIELTAKTCHKCQTYARSASAVIDSQLKHAQLPWHTLHIDFAGTLDGYYYLVVVDAFPKWLEVRRMKSTTSASIVGELRKLFSTFGVPRVVVSDNAPNLVSAEMAQFYHRNGVKHRTRAPFHPATNGQAERMVGETKRALKKLTGSLDCRLARFLFKQHTTVSATTHKTPAELLFGRRLTTPLDLLHPEEEYATSQHSDLASLESRYKVGQAVYIRTFDSDRRWTSAVIQQHTGRCSFAVSTSDGKVHRRHVEHIKARLDTPGERGAPEPDGITSASLLLFPHEGDDHSDEQQSQSAEQNWNSRTQPTDRDLASNRQEQAQMLDDDNVQRQDSCPSSSTQATGNHERPRHQRRAPQQFKDFVLS
ncbi:uncharacterized protein K02A2.6-like [Ornithodoros turicata]|uniref:uncharacterized protein K02A2.6-like n=1 Tax=Ornithodoros turicata TaxID=34597 RepID=UPI003139D420